MTSSSETNHAANADETLTQLQIDAWRAEAEDFFFRLRRELGCLTGPGGTNASPSPVQSATPLTSHVVDPKPKVREEAPSDPEPQEAVKPAPRETSPADPYNLPRAVSPKKPSDPTTSSVRLATLKKQIAERLSQAESEDTGKTADE